MGAQDRRLETTGVVGSMLAKHEHAVEVRRQAIQAALDSSKSAAERNRLGQFATPYALAVEIARYVESIAGNRLRAIRFADPAIAPVAFTRLRLRCSAWRGSKALLV